MSPGPRPTSPPSGILIHLTVWPQYTNVTDRQTEQTERQRSDNIWRTVLQTVAQKRLNRSRCRLGCGLVGAQETTCWMGSRFPLRKGNFMGKDIPGNGWRHSAVSCAKMAELIEMSFGLWTCVGRRKHVVHGGHWRNLANTNEPSVSGGDAALTVSNYFYHLLL